MRPGGHRSRRSPSFRGAIAEEGGSRELAAGVAFGHTLPGRDQLIVLEGTGGSGNAKERESRGIAVSSQGHWNQGLALDCTRVVSWDHGSPRGNGRSASPEREPGSAGRRGTPRRWATAVSGSLGRVLTSRSGTSGPHPEIVRFPWAQLSGVRGKLLGGEPLASRCGNLRGAPAALVGRSERRPAGPVGVTKQVCNCI